MHQKQVLSAGDSSEHAAKSSGAAGARSEPGCSGALIITERPKGGDTTYFKKRENCYKLACQRSHYPKPIKSRARENVHFAGQLPAPAAAAQKLN